MSFVCKVAGHKWNKLADGSDGCTCSRCGERRDEGHDWRIVSERKEWTNSWSPKIIRGHFKECSVCGRWENVPTPEEERRAQLLAECRDKGHDWQGCKCARCGESRDQDHTWGNPKPLSEHFKDYKTHHVVKCTRCGKSQNRPHSFKPAAGGMQRCKRCGVEVRKHPEFRTPEAESDYYAKLIASGEVGYFDTESKRGQLPVKYGDRVTTLSALTRLFAALADNDRADNHVPMSIVWKLKDIASNDSSRADDVDYALFKLACNEEVHIWWRGWLLDKIEDPDRKKEANEVVERWHEAHPRSQADIDMENMLIAMDSGLGRSG